MFIFSISTIHADSLPIPVWLVVLAFRFFDCTFSAVHTGAIIVNHHEVMVANSITAILTYVISIIHMFAILADSLFFIAVTHLVN
jgi:hypothetical protein